MANVVEAVGLVKEFRDFCNRPKAKAVNDIDFEVREGVFLGLLPFPFPDGAADDDGGCTG